MGDKIVDVKYIKSEDNVLDICTKNLPTNLFEKHSNDLMSECLQAVIQDRWGKQKHGRIPIG